MPKETRLDDDALLYHPREKQTEKEKLREMSFQEKISYLLEYYKFQAIAIVAGIALIIYIVHMLLNPSPTTQFYVAIVDNPISEDVLKQYENNFTKQLQLNPKRETVEFNTNFMFNSDDTYAMNMKQALSTYVAAKEIDVIIAPKSVFHDYAYYGYFSKLSDQLPTDIYSSLTDKFYITDTEDDHEKSDYGVYLADTKLFKDTANSSDPYVLGILANSPHEDNTIKFIRYLFHDK
jgi:hypothetical protein